MGLVRFGIVGYESYLWLNWNLFLALLPLLFVWLLRGKHGKILGYIYFIGWLFFLPNAPYLITDFIHLADVGPKTMLWYDGLMIFVYSLVGIAVWLVTTRSIKKHFNIKNWFVPVIGLLTGFGIYLGRYIRFNTWDIISKPSDILETLFDIVIHPGNHEPVLMMTITFAAVLSGLYFAVYRYQTNETTKD